MQGKEMQEHIVQSTSGWEDGSCLNPEDCKHLVQAACCSQLCLHFACCSQRCLHVALNAVFK